MRILLRGRDIPDLYKLEVYQANGGYDALKKAVAMQPAEVAGGAAPASRRA